MDMERFDSFIEGQGVDIEIFSALICPLEATSTEAGNHMGHSQCSNGFIYKCQGRIRAAFVGNSGNPNFQPYGIERDAVAYMTVPRFYDQPHGKPVIIGHYYRIYLADCETPVVNSERIEHNATNIDRPSFPIMDVLALMDSHGKEYRSGVDFDIVGGDIHWRQGRDPGFQTDLNRGEIFSIEYTYKPFYYVKHIPHETRVTRVLHPITGEEQLVRAPYQLVLEREWVSHTKNRVLQEPGQQRSIAAPRSGGFGPR